MKVTVIFEVAKDGGIWAHTDDKEFKEAFIFGNGQTVEECREDFMVCYEEVQEIRDIPTLEFVWKYDIASFFKHYKVLDVTAFAKKINMNASLMRRYKAGTPVTEKTYLRIREGIHSVGQELMTAFM